MVHQFKLGGYNIVVDVASGSVHVVDDIAYDIISSYQKYRKEEIFSIIKDKYLQPGESLSEVEECYLLVRYKGVSRAVEHEGWSRGVLAVIHLALS